MIPDSIAHTFNVYIKEDNSFLPQDLANMSTAEFKLLDPTDSYSIVLTSAGTEVSDQGLWYNVDDTEYTTPFNTEQEAIDGGTGDTAVIYDGNATYLNGKVEFTIPPTDLEVSQGDEVDWFYSKPRYTATIQITFSDSTPDKFVKISKVYVIPTGV